jgi:hypothetical protein
MLPGHSKRRPLVVDPFLLNLPDLPLGQAESPGDLLANRTQCPALSRETEVIRAILEGGGEVETLIQPAQAQLARNPGIFLRFSFVPPRSVW